MNLSVVSEDIISIYKRYGHQKYNERCSILSHSIQTGLIAKQKGYDNELILAGFLYNIGRLIPFRFDSEQLKKIKCFEEKTYYKLGEAYLRRKGFSERVIAPITNHIESKRYLCFKDRGYYEKLSLDSQQKIEQHGGIMDDKEAKNFEQHPYFKESILIQNIKQKSRVKGFIILEHHFNLIESLINFLPVKSK